MRRRSRWLLRIVAALIVLAILGVSAAIFAMRGSLAKLDGEIALAGLSAPASIERDALGIATITAEDRRDLSRALGFVHAQERYFEMDLTRRSAAGELAELFGKATLPIDRRHRVHRFRARANRWLADMPTADRALMQAYTEGVNAGLAAHRIRPWPYLLLRTQPRPWREEDGLLVVIAMFFDLQDEDNARERDLDQARRVLPASVFDFIVRTGSQWDAPIVGAATGEPPLPSETEIDLRDLPPVAPDDADTKDIEVPGSNSFAVSGALTSHGRAIVADDMHLGLRAPNIWLRARLVHGAGDNRVDVQGVTLPGVPAVVVGSNGHIAWAFTNSYGDWLDFVRLEVDPANPERYRTAAGWHEFGRSVERISIGSDLDRDNDDNDHPDENDADGDDDAAEDIRASDDSAATKGERIPSDQPATAVAADRSSTHETLIVRETLWGPVIGEDADGTLLALAWTAHRDGAVNTDLLALETARDVDSAIAIAARAGVPAQNFIVGDAQGRIAWTIAGRIPQRIEGFDPAQPAQGIALDGDLWRGWLSPDAYPRVVDPESGRLWTANARVVDGAMLATIGDGGYDNGARAAQIRDGLLGRADFDEGDLLAIQLDDRALFMERWWLLLRQVVAGAAIDTPLRELEAAITSWDGCACIDSVSYRLARAFRLYVHETLMRGLEAPVRLHDPDFRWPRMGQNEGVIWQLLRERPAHLLPPPHESWDALLVSQAQRVVDALAAAPGGLSARTWGEANTVRVRHPVSRVLPAFLGALLDMPSQPLPGDSHMPRVQGVDFGASQRMVVAPGLESQAIMHMPGGQSGHPMSPYYGAGHDDWMQGRPAPLRPSAPRWRLDLVPTAAPSSTN
jgi:penicillin amidase